MFSRIILLSSLLSFSITNIQARWFWYQPEPVIVVQQPVIVQQEISPEEAIVSATVGLGACLGMGIHSIVKHQNKKKLYKEYINTFYNMGYSHEQSKLYAKMAVDHEGGLEAVIKNIEEEKRASRAFNAELDLKQQSHEQVLQEKELAHKQKLQELSHEYQFKMLLYVIITLLIALITLCGYIIFRRKNK